MLFLQKCHRLLFLPNKKIAIKIENGLLIKVNRFFAKI